MLTTFFLLTTSLGSADAARPTVQLPEGKVVGKVVNGVEWYAQIPYTSPPLGELRWRPPSPNYPAFKNGVVDETDNFEKEPTYCWQIPLENLPGANPNGKLTEDCLTIHVRTPTTKPGDGKLLPVFVFIHGGAWMCDGQASDDGTLMAKEGMVVVTMDYRLNVFGFMATDEQGLAGGTTGGMNGVWDQVQALRWVRDHIKYFGGDPNQVTIGGESSGAMSIATHLLTPESKGLFHRAFMISGATGGGALTKQQGKQQTLAIARQLNFTDISPQTIAAMKKMDAKTIFEASLAAVGPNGMSDGQFPSWRSIDGYLVDTIPEDQFMNPPGGNYNIPASEIIHGIMTSDGTSSAPQFNPSTNFNQNELLNLEAVLGAYFNEDQVDQLMDATAFFGNDMKRLIFISAASQMMCGTLHLATKADPLKDSRFFMFGAAPKGDPNTYTDNSGFNFGMTYHSGSNPSLFWTDSDKTLIETEIFFPSGDSRTGQTYRQAFGAFVKGGDQLLAKRGWPRFNKGTNGFMFFGEHSHMQPFSKGMALASVCEVIEQMPMGLRINLASQPLQFGATKAIASEEKTTLGAAYEPWGRNFADQGGFRGNEGDDERVLKMLHRMGWGDF